MNQHSLCANIPFPANTAPSADDYASLFSSPDGDLLVFAASAGVHDAQAYHSENDFKSRPVIGGIMQSFTLDYVEAVFIAACWESTRNFRHDIPSSFQRPLTVCVEPRVLMSLYPVTAYSTCMNCGDLIGSDTDGRWYHVTDMGGIRERGCRAASFRTLGDYNQNLKAGLMATPC